MLVATARFALTAWQSARKKKMVSRIFVHVTYKGKPPTEVPCDELCQRILALHMPTSRNVFLIMRV